jgi:hypothetical protein
LLLNLIISTYFSLAPQTALASNQIPSELVCIADHESGMEQFTPSGKPLVSPTNDYGVMQIHYTWIPLAKKMGLDVVHNAQDNIEFGIWLFNTHGASQWTTDQYCKGSGVG